VEWLVDGVNVVARGNSFGPELLPLGCGMNACCGMVDGMHVVE